MKFTKRPSLKKMVLIPLSVAFALLLTAFVASLWWIETRSIKHNCMEKLNSADILLSEKISSDTENMLTLIETLQNSSEIKKYWLTKDRSGLHAYLRKLYKTLNKEYYYSYLSFHNKDFTTFLNVDQPQTYGEQNKTRGLLEAEKTGYSQGIVLNKHGTPTLHTIQKWVINGETAGYIDMGKQIMPSSANIREALGVDILVILEKAFIDRDLWEKKNNPHHNSASWDLFKDVVVAYSIEGRIPPDIGKFIKHRHNYRDAVIDVKMHARSYIGGFIPLYDVNKRSIGNIVILHDKTRDLAELRDTLGIILMSCMAVWASLFKLFFLILNSTEKQLNEYQKKAVEESKSRIDTQIKYTKEMQIKNNLLKNEIADKIKTESKLRSAKEETEKQKEQLQEVNIQLKRTYKKLMEASHQAGMAEVATGVLHNIGNVLNSVNVTTDLISEKVTNSEISNLKTLAEMVHSHINDLEIFLKQDPKGKHIPSYLIQVCNLLTEEQNQIIETLKDLTRNIEHIKEIVKKQQDHAKSNQHIEIAVDITEAIQDAIQINEASLKKYKITIKQQLEPLPEVMVDRTGILQILVNLIGNARQALAESEEPDKTLHISCSKTDDEHIQIQISDNGIGISPENQSKIFRHGFTTKRFGHGFGLHSCALSAKQMGGSLSFESEGLGMGAAFILEVPFKPAEVQKC